MEIAVAGIRVGVWGHTRIIQQQNRWLQVRGRCSAFTGATLASSLLGPRRGGQVAAGLGRAAGSSSRTL